MFHGDRLRTMVIRNVFAEEIATLGGIVTDVFDDGEQLFVRSVLPHVREVDARDSVQDGIALRTTDCDIWIHPYVFRRVCRNGAIMAWTLQSRRIEGLDSLPPDETESAIREALHACADEEHFLEFAEGIRSARQVQVDIVVTLMPLLSQFPGHEATRLLRDITSRFVEEQDLSQFGLMNAVTSVARETSEPNLRWRLEEFGGGILLRRPHVPPLDSARGLQFAES